MGLLTDVCGCVITLLTPLTCKRSQVLIPQGGGGDARQCRIYERAKRPIAPSPLYTKKALKHLFYMIYFGKVVFFLQSSVKVFYISFFVNLWRLKN